MRYLGMIILTSSGILFGLYRVSILRENIKFIEELKYLINHIEFNIAYSSQTLEEIIVSYNSNITKEIRKELEINKDIVDSWTTVSKNHKNDLMEKFISDFGRSDLTSQMKVITLYKNLIQINEDKLINDYREKYKIEFAVPSFIAIVVSIIFI